MTRRNYHIEGIVQGVGFRPFVYALATRLGLTGTVYNHSGGVELILQGEETVLNLAEEQLMKTLPPLARIDTMIITVLESDPHIKNFEIIASSTETSKSALVSPDVATCQDCLEDMERFEKYRDYFATNCTNCGPRYSIIKTVPYDRVNTSMLDFEMCQSCAEEYSDPYNRRYHAQPIACNACGPKLTETIEEAAMMIKAGKIIAIKGLGGFHIVCDATNTEVVNTLRVSKNRPSKPFALMCKDMQMVGTIAHVSDDEKRLLISKEAPVVLIKKRIPSMISESIAPHIGRVGCMLAYTPLYHMIFRYLNAPIIATSANLGSEPVIIDAATLRRKLPFVEFVVDFDREIINAVDDSVVQVVHGAAEILRLGRGYAPKVIKMPQKSPRSVLAVGAHQKNTIALLIEDNLILSPHIGDLDSPEAFDFFERTVETFARFYDFEPDVIVCDKHPEYRSTKWAKAQNVPLLAVQHHLAHIYACKAEFGLSGDYLGFSFDGTGYGDDGTLWGGEVFVADTRTYHFKPIKLLGGEKAIREPRRVALSMLFERYGLEAVKQIQYACVRSFEESELELLHQGFTKGINAPLSSSVGRLFDAIASFAGLLQYQSYEGEAGLLCETHYDLTNTQRFTYRIENGVIDIDYDFGTEDIVTRFINTLVEIIIDIAQRESKEVILSGGVFQNRTLLELTCKRLEETGITYYRQQQTPINDGGIALGQIFWYLQRCEDR